MQGNLYLNVIATDAEEGEIDLSTEERQMLFKNVQHCVAQCMEAAKEHLTLSLENCIKRDGFLAGQIDITIEISAYDPEDFTEENKYPFKVASALVNEERPDDLPNANAPKQIIN